LEFVENHCENIKDPLEQKNKANALLKQLQRISRSEKQAGSADT
jgi:hypothetical protein